MKKTKKIVSTILGLLSAFSFKSSAMGIDYDDDELKNEDDLYSELDNQKDISLGSKPLIGTVGVGLLYCGKLYYNSLNKSPEEYLLETCGKKYLDEFKNNAELIELKQTYIKQNPNFFLVKCSDEIIKHICNYYTFITAMQNLYNGQNFGDTVEQLERQPEMIAFHIIKNSYAVEMKMKGDIMSYSYTVAMCIIRSLFDEKVLNIRSGKPTVTNGDFDDIVNTCFSILDKYVGDEGEKMRKKFGKDKQEPYNGELKKFYSWMACCLGAELWKKLYPTKEYDEKEYLRLQKQLSV